MKPVAASKLRVILGYTNATKFKNSYIVPLMEQGLVVMSQPDKPNSPTQKYYLTEKGKRVIGSVGAGVEGVSLGVEDVKRLLGYKVILGTDGHGFYKKDTVWWRDGNGLFCIKLY